MPVLKEVVIDGQRWLERREAAHPLLVPGAKLVGLVPPEFPFKQPPNETFFVRAPDGRLASIRCVRDLMPHLVPVTTADQALDYTWFLRLFPIGLPGLGAATPNRFGVSQRSLEEDLRGEDIDPDPVIQSLPEGFEITRLVVVMDVENSRPTYRLVRIRERVTREGAYEAEVLETVRADESVERWIFRPL